LEGIIAKTRLIATEKDVQRAIMDYLQLKGYMCWRNNTGAFRATHNGKERFHRYGHPGSGDILGLTKNGTFFSIEVKANNNKPTPLQNQWIEWIKANNGIAFVAYGVDDVSRYL